MKANEAPEKVYVHVKDDKVCNTWNSTWIGVNDIEYTRTDSFIEKACKYLFENYHGEKLSLRMIEDLKNYMKGE